MNNHDKLLAQLNELEGYFKYRDSISESVSNATVGWQAYHILKVLYIVSNAIIASDPNDYKKQFNKYKAVFFTFNYFPRGKARAPRVSRPPETFNLEDLTNQLKLVNQNLKDFLNLEPNANFKHHIFGYLNKKETQKFFVLHTEHHLKIIRDILKTN
jgi:hypothetical protein